MFVGISITIIGIIFLLQNLKIINGDIWQIIWPALLIAAGLSMICKKKGICYCGCQNKEEK
ncbi:MAG: DUF5668 domain-containing protein [Candidatus Pacebacteria bacterium]|nr:DUF5668 domain-containing protein [Candidatus Paceibacterota bacterium]